MRTENAGSVVASVINYSRPLGVINANLIGSASCFAALLPSCYVQLMVIVKTDAKCHTIQPNGRKYLDARSAPRRTNQRQLKLERRSIEVGRVESSRVIVNYYASLVLFFYGANSCPIRSSRRFAHRKNNEGEDDFRTQFNICRYTCESRALNILESFL